MNQDLTEKNLLSETQKTKAELDYIDGCRINLIYFNEDELNEFNCWRKPYRMVKDIIKQKISGQIKKCERCSPNSFYSCQWQWDDDKLSKYYLAYRLLHAVAFLFILGISLIDRGRIGEDVDIFYYIKWPIYLTNWSLCANVVQAITAAYILLRTFIAFIGQNDELGVFIMRPCLWFYWILHTISLSVSFGVSIVYWYYVYNPEIHDLNMVNYCVHLANSFFMFIDFLVVGHPLKFLHCVYPACFVILYSIFNWIYASLGGTDRHGRTYIYKVMDWSEPKQCIIFVTEGIGLVLALHMFFWLIFLVKKAISVRFRMMKMKFHVETESELTDDMMKNSPV